MEFPSNTGQTSGSIMAMKSDFGQKLLHDLRLRKERMAAAQRSASQTSHTSRDFRGTRIHRGSQQANAVESARRHSGGSSNQIVLYEGAKNSRQINNLSMAVAFAFENTVKLSKNNLLDFFERLSGGSISFRKMDMVKADNRSLSVYDSNPRLSTIQISEVRKGVQKLNQIIRACSNGPNLNRNTIEMGQQLLRGAMNLEESLRVLANMQEGVSSQARGRSRTMLIEENEENNQDKEEEQADQWRVDRPRFSFDKPSKNSGSAGTAKYMFSYLNEVSKENDMASQRKHGEKRGEQDKGKISNIVAKLMGLEELPQKEEKMGTQKDFSSEGKQMKASSSNNPLHGNCNKPITTVVSGSKMDQMMKSERNGAQEQANMGVVLGSKVALPTRTGEEKQSAVQNTAQRIQIYHDREKKRASAEIKERRTLQVIEKPKLPENEHRARKKGQQLQKQNLMAKKQKDHHQLESLDSRKTKRAVVNHEKTVCDKGRRARKEESERSKSPQQMARKGETVNGLTRPLKQSAYKLQHMKEQMDKKRRTSKGLDQGRIKLESSAETSPKEQNNKLSIEDAPETEKKQNSLPPCDNVSPQTNFPMQESEARAHDSPVDHENQYDHSRDVSGEGHIPSGRQQRLLTEIEKELKEIVIRSQLFLNTAESFFKLNIPVTFLHTIDKKHENRENNLKLDCAYEVMKRRARRNEATHIAYQIKTTLSCPKIRCLDDLVRHLCKDFEMLKLYGGGDDDERDIALYLHKMLEKDIYNKHPDINCMWSHEWSNIMLMFSVREDIVRYVEQHVLSELLDELTHDLHFL